MGNILRLIIIFALLIAFAILFNTALDYVMYSVHEMFGVPYYPSR